MHYSFPGILIFLKFIHKKDYLFILDQKPVYSSRKGRKQTKGWVEGPHPKTNKQRPQKDYLCSFLIGEQNLKSNVFKDSC